MKIGFCSNMNASSPNGIGWETFHLFRDAGYDYVELPLTQVMQLPDTDFSELIGNIEIFDEGCYACNNFFPSEIKLTGPAVDYNEIERYAIAAIDRAHKLGAEIIVLGSAESKNIPDGFPKSEAETQLKRSLSLINDILQNSGIRVALEPLNRIECNMINTISQAYAIVREVDLDSIGVLCDFYHLSVEREPLEVLNVAGEKLMHVHLAALLGRRFPLSDREGIHQLIRELVKMEYKGYISIEAYSKKLTTEPRDTLKMLRSIISGFKGV